MKFGITYDCSVDGTFQGDRLIDLSTVADTLGFDYVWVEEGRRDMSGANLAAPEIALGALAARTARIRLGAVAIAAPLPLACPERLAERTAMLDALSHGRTDLALARARYWTDVAGAEAAPSDLPAAWERAIAHCGARLEADQLWGVAAEEGEAAHVGASGLNLLLPCALAPESASHLVGAYRAAGGNGQVSAGALMLCAADDARGQALGLEMREARRQVMGQRVSAEELALGRARAGAAAQPGLMAGDPKTLIDALRTYEQIGVDMVNFAVNAGGVLAQADVLASLRLFAAEVMPVFQRAGARVAAE